MKNQSLLIIGPDVKLRGVGGVTIHVHRLCEFLEKMGYEYDFMDYKSNSKWTLCCEIARHKLVHIHISNPVYQFVVVLIARWLGKKTIVTLHGDYGRFSSLKNTLVEMSLRLATVPVVINEKSYDVCKVFNERTVLIPAFIPPQKDETLQEEAVEIMEGIHGIGRELFVTNASNVSFDKNGNEIYGIDFLVNYFKDAKDRVLVISDPSGNYKMKYKELNTNSVIFINYPHPFYEVLKRADYSVRNTCTDGDALSVRESLYLGIPTLCTDVVDRPEGVRLFKYCDRRSFEEAIKTPSPRCGHTENGAVKVLGLYKQLCGAGLMRECSEDIYHDKNEK